MEAISGSARRHLRSLGHHLQPVVLVGKEGLSDALIEATRSALATHELIKVKLGDSVEGDRRELAASLATSSKSDLVGVMGRTLLLYKRNPKKPKIELPDPKAKKKKKGTGEPAAAAPKKKGAKGAAPIAEAAESGEASDSSEELDGYGDDDGDDFEDD